ncbi:double-strand break repair protein AddB [Gymnodinialimonas sp. 2305UL16-5]|uniref:double-strand break repair protein AddB n=1 Tax=Gymnodinialimonas mytili TaxID=3126503 RepID=UPI0030AB71EC
MFEATQKARVFATPIGVDFCSALIDGLDARLAGQGPEVLARIEIHVANLRMQRRLHTLYAQRGPGLLPRIRPVLALSETADMEGMPPAMSPLALRLELAQLISKLLDRNPSLAPRSAIYALADSLADFLGEMVEEGVAPADIAALNMGEHSAHWARAQAFLGIASDLIAASDRPTPEGRQAMVVDRLIAEWRLNPPAHPVLVAGSTGSRRATFRLMEAVAQLPQGAVILPGIDRDMPSAIWRDLLDNRRSGLAGEDHPQFRLAKLLDHLGLAPDDAANWIDTAPTNPARNRLVSLALRPAPVTDQWRVEGPQLSDISGALADVTLLEAPSPQMEAAAIALRLRQAVEDGQRAALVTPDRRLSRMVSAQLDRWRIVPDESGGQVLAQTAPGRFLRQVAELVAHPMTNESLVALLKHPLCHSGPDRAVHLLRTRDLELQVLRRGLAKPNAPAFRAWAAKRSDDAGAKLWVEWLCKILMYDLAGTASFSKLVQNHADLSKGLAAGSNPVDPKSTAELYEKEPGAEAARLMEDLRKDAASGGAMSARDYADFFAALAADREVRFAVRPHADVLIWGTQEARVQGADLTILAGLNEGIWPKPAEADPWLNRPLRSEAGLRLPDRVVGLSAHDFQQGIAGREVWLSRAKRDDETDTVPARWVNRLVNLLGGASDETQKALADMSARGHLWVARAQALVAPHTTHPPAPRPAPSPQTGARLSYLSVTDVERLIRDPYAIYARHILKLRALNPLNTVPDARLRGTIIHRILQEFLKQIPNDLPENAAQQFSDICDDILITELSQNAVRALWRQRLGKVAPWYLAREAELRDLAEPWLVEDFHKWDVPGLSLTLGGTADRIDRLPDGRVAIYDYKTGRVPTEQEVTAFNKQLWLEALMARGGAIADHPLDVARMAYIGLGTNPEIRDEHPDEARFAQVLNGLGKLIAHYRRQDVGFTSRRSPSKTFDTGDYDHLARYGEWDATTDATILPVGGADGE